WDGSSGLKDWMASCVHRAADEQRKGTLSLIQLIAWELWRERNRRLFQKEAQQKAALIRLIKDEIHLWNMAGAGIPFDPG
uniref:Uncharacterized protein n=1 Tax=Aegilops tauschii subsp. strangulata TaxID=200361 RepID=A0A453ELE9_AEGTS